MPDFPSLDTLFVPFLKVQFERKMLSFLKNHGENVNTKITILYTTIGSAIEAEKLAKQAVAQGYAACVNIIPGALSIYEWEGKIEKSEEHLMIFKTTPIQSAALEQWISQNHPYSVPALLQGHVNASHPFSEYVHNMIPLKDSHQEQK